jgi:hypothetical protein
MKSLLLITFEIIAYLHFPGPGCCWAKDDLAKIKKEQSAMNAIVEQFSRDSYLCSEGGGGLRLAISPYLPDRDSGQWPEESRKSIAACGEKFIVTMERKGSRSAHVYCYDGQVPKLVASTPEPDDNSPGCAREVVQK